MTEQSAHVRVIETHRVAELMQEGRVTVVVNSQCAATG